MIQILELLTAEAFAEHVGQTPAFGATSETKIKNNPDTILMQYVATARMVPPG